MNQHFIGKGAPIKAWTVGLPIEERAMQQLLTASEMPFIHRHLAVMPDVHWGVGATVGSVMATKGAIIPAAVGVDLGCGMIAARTTLVAEDLPDNLHKMRLTIEAAVPHGRSNKGDPGLDAGSWRGVVSAATKSAWDALQPWYANIVAKYPRAGSRSPVNQLGTLGTGNHFIEVCLDENRSVWVLLHSGSRGAGNALGTYFINRAKEEMARWHITSYLPDGDLAYLVEHTELFDDYVHAVEWAQNYAAVNRRLMLDAVLRVMQFEVGQPFVVSDAAIDCHHNYVSHENHFAANVWVARKGAVRARVGDRGIIPGSMGTGSFIVRGLGNPDSFFSCSHGAGRVMSRGEAKRQITMADHATAMVGIEARLDADVLDESPAAYKDIGKVMAAQEDLVEIETRLRQILNVKG